MESHVLRKQFGFSFNGRFRYYREFVYFDIVAGVFLFIPPTECARKLNRDFLTVHFFSSSSTSLRNRVEKLFQFKQKPMGFS